MPGLIAALRELSEEKERHKYKACGTPCAAVNTAKDYTAKLLPLAKHCPHILRWQTRPGQHELQCLLLVAARTRPPIQCYVLGALSTGHSIVCLSIGSLPGCQHLVLSPALWCVCIIQNLSPCREHTEDTEHAKILVREAFSAVVCAHSFSPPFFLSLATFNQAQKYAWHLGFYYCQGDRGHFLAHSLISHAISTVFHLCTNSCCLELNFNYR